MAPGRRPGVGILVTGAIVGVAAAALALGDYSPRALDRAAAIGVAWNVGAGLGVWLGRGLVGAVFKVMLQQLERSVRRLGYSGPWPLPGTGARPSARHVLFASAPWLFMLATLLAFSVGLSSVFLQGGGLGVAPLLPAIGGGAAVVSVLALTISCVPIVRLRLALRRGHAAPLGGSPPADADLPAAGSLRSVGAQMSRVATWSGQAAPR